LTRVSHQGLTWFSDEALASQRGPRVVFTTRLGGVSAAPYTGLDLATHVGDEPAAVEANRLLLLEALGIPALRPRLVCPNQVHGDRIVEVDARTASMGVPDADGLLCVETDVPVLLCFADCTPVVVVAPGGGFCVAHAGWRGALAGIAGKAVRALAQRTGADASTMNAYVGPHIGACCYQTSAEIAGRFAAAFTDACILPDRHLDLGAAVRCDLGRAGVLPERIVSVPGCTSCDDDLFYSYRAEGGTCGRHGALVCLVDDDGEE